VRMACSGGPMTTWLEKAVKLVTPNAFAFTNVTAVEGAVVSKPTAKNTTSRSGSARAISSASSGE
jgi:hypothetical protein